MTLPASKKRILFASLLVAIVLLAANCSNGADNSDPILDFPPAKAAAAGLLHTCALHEGGSVSCWGDNWRGQLGNGTELPDFEAPSFDPSEIEMGSAVPVAVTEIADSAAIDAGFFHTCALHSDGRVSCWGENSLGQLGNGESEEEARSSVPVSVSGITDAADIATGSRHSCALLSDGTISCWGNNYFGQLGNGESGREFFGGNTPDGFVFSDLPALVPGIDDAIDVAAGESHTCAIHRDSSVSCWGHNGNGQLGSGNTGFWRHSVTPQKVEGIDAVIAIATGEDRTCVIHQDGTVSCWGRNWNGELGNGTTDNYSNAPVRVKNITNASFVSAGNGHACALHEDSTISCWGNNDDGQLGNETRDDSDIPVQVKNITGATAVTAGNSHTCALHRDGTISCWGNNVVGQLGNGNSGKGEHSPVPAKIQGITNAIAVSASVGYYLGHTCALLENGTISCWGRNGSGQLGTGQSTEGDISPIPVAVQNITDATAISTGEEHTCALREGGTISCWGNNFGGKLGNFETADEYSALPVPVDGITGAIQVTAGEEHSCALHQDGTISCWGSMEEGRLGNGSNPWLPQKVIGLGG